MLSDRLFVIDSPIGLFETRRNAAYITLKLFTVHARGPRVHGELSRFSQGSNAQFVGIIPPIVCINVAIRTYENKSFF